MHYMDNNKANREKGKWELKNAKSYSELILEKHPTKQQLYNHWTPIS